MTFTRAATLLLFIGLLLQPSFAPAAARSRPPAPRQPVAFTDPYLDGYVMTLWTENRTDDEVRVILDRITRTGARHLTLPFFGCQTDLKSSDPGFCERSTRAYVMRVAGLAREKGFAVSLLPIVLTPNWEWRGFFDPTDVDAWFASYGKFIGELARDAEKAGMAEVIVATEMTILNRHTEHWRTLLRRLRQDFHGPLVITVNWGDESQDFWDETDAIGVSAYYPLSVRENPSQLELDESATLVRDRLLKISRRFARPVHMTEVGFHSTSHAARTPWMPGEGAVTDFALQKRCFEAVTKAWTNQRELVRLNVWAAEDPSLPGAPRGHDLLGTPAEAVLHAFFDRRFDLRP